MLIHLVFQPGWHSTRRRAKLQRVSKKKQATKKKPQPVRKKKLRKPEIMWKLPRRIGTKPLKGFEKALQRAV